MNIRKDDLIELIKHLEGTYKCQYCYYNYSYQCTLGKTCDVGVEHFLDFDGKSLNDKVKTAQQFNNMIKEHRKNNNAST